MEFKLKRFNSVLKISRIANIHYFEFTKEYHTFKDRHAFRELVYVDSGYINVESEGYTGILSQNNIIIHKEGEVHSLECPSNDAPNVIIIGFECHAPELDVFSITPTELSFECQKLLIDIIREGRTVFLPPYDVPNLKDMKKRKNYPYGADQVIKIKLELFFIELIRAMLRNSTSDNQRAVTPKTAEVHSYITEHFCEKITLDELCFLFGTNKTSLCNNFKRTYNQTITNYINILRIKKAKQLLRKGTHNQTEIAEMLGFSSVHYLSRVFKQIEGKSPTAYIKTLKSKLEEN